MTASMLLWARHGRGQTLMESPGYNRKCDKRAEQKWHSETYAPSTVGIFSTVGTSSPSHVSPPFFTNRSSPFFFDKEDTIPLRSAPVPPVVPTNSSW